MSENLPGAAILSATGISAGYGDSVIVRDVNLEIGQGEVVALLGHNGVGKSTTLGTLAGCVKHRSGEIRLMGQPIPRHAHRRARRGVAFVTEERSVFMQLSVAENLRVGRADADFALDLFPELKKRWRVRAGDLSGGEQQMLTLGRALARRPKVLLADELSLGLAPQVVRRLLETVRRAATEDGIGVMLVEQHLTKALEYSDRVYMMQRGRIAHEGKSAHALENIDHFRDLYLAGGSPEELA